MYYTLVLLFLQEASLFFLPFNLVSSFLPIYPVSILNTFFSVRWLLLSSNFTALLAASPFPFFCHCASRSLFVSTLGTVLDHFSACPALSVLIFLTHRTWLLLLNTIIFLYNRVLLLLFLIPQNVKRIIFSSDSAVKRSLIEENGFAWIRHRTYDPSKNMGIADYEWYKNYTKQKTMKIITF